jgi:hypothetical protein
MSKTIPKWIFCLQTAFKKTRTGIVENFFISPTSNPLKNITFAQKRMI